MSAEDTPTPVERLSFGLQTTAELREAISAINQHLAVCAASVKTAKERNEALMSELKQRQEDAHRLALAAFACPKCGNQKLDDIRMGDPCGYEWHPLTEARVGDGGGPQSFLTAHYGDGCEHEPGVFILVDGELAREVDAIRVAWCQRCEAHWPWPADLQVEYD